MAKIFLVLVVLATVAYAPPVVGQNSWMEIPIPPHIEYMTALTAGTHYLFAAMRDSSDERLGLFRTPLLSPGNWEPLGMVGHAIWDIEVAGAGDSNLLVAVSGDTVVYRSTDGGLSWLKGDNGLPLSGGACEALARDGGYPGLVYSALRDATQPDTWFGICVSTNFGVTWETCREFPDNNWKWTIAAPRDESLLAYAAIYNGYWMSVGYMTTNGGTSWSAMEPPGLWEAPPLDTAISANDPHRFYLLAPFCLDEFQGGVLQESHVPPFYVTSIEAPVWQPGGLFAAGTETQFPSALHVARWDEATGEWILLNEGLPDELSPEPLQIEWRFCLAAAPEHRILFYSAPTLGLWMRYILEPAGVTLTDAFGTALSVSPPQPNPSSGSVAFQMSGSQIESAELQIVDAAGRLVRRLAAAAESPSIIVWDGRLADGQDAPTGVYYIVARSSEIMVTEKAMIIR